MIQGKRHPLLFWRRCSGDRDRQKTETLCFSFHVFVFFLFTSLTVPLLSWCLNLFSTCVYVPTTAWPRCHLAKLHTSRSFHLSLWTSLSSVFNHFGSSFLNSMQFKNKLNWHPCGLKSRLLQSPAEHEPWLGACGGERAPCCSTVSSRLLQQWRPGKGGDVGKRQETGLEAMVLFFSFPTDRLVDWYRWMLTFVSASRGCKSTVNKQKVLIASVVTWPPNFEEAAQVTCFYVYHSRDISSKYSQMCSYVCVCVYVSSPPFLHMWWLLYALLSSSLFLLAEYLGDLEIGWSIFTLNSSFPPCMAV